MFYPCRECDGVFTSLESLRRHDRYKHGESVECEFCSYKCPKNAEHRMANHYRAKHPGPHYEHQGRAKKRNTDTKDRKRPSSQSRERTPRKVVKTSTDSLNTPEHIGKVPTPISPLLSPISIGLYDYDATLGDLSPVDACKRNLLDELFPSPAPDTAIAVEPLASSSTQAPTSTRVVVSSDDTLYSPTCPTAPPHQPTRITPAATGKEHEPSSPTSTEGARRVHLQIPQIPYLPQRLSTSTHPYGTLYEHRHLVPPLTDDDPRLMFLGAPSLYSRAPAAETLRRIRLRARMSGRSHVAYPEDQRPGIWLRMVERSSLDDGTQYELDKTWFPDPTFVMRKSVATITSPAVATTITDDTGSQTPRPSSSTTETQTPRPSSSTTETQTPRPSSSSTTETQTPRPKTTETPSQTSTTTCDMGIQCSIISLNL